MKTNIKIDYSANIILVTKGFLQQAEIFGTDEYKILKQIRKDYPSMMVVAKTVRSGNRKSDTKGLTYKYMRRFIAIMDAQNLPTFDKVMLHYELHEENNTSVYHLVKDWFLENYPHHKEMIVAAAPQRKLSPLPWEAIEENAAAA